MHTQKATFKKLQNTNIGKNTFLFVLLWKHLSSGAAFGFLRSQLKRNFTHFVGPIFSTKAPQYFHVFFGNQEVKSDKQTCSFASAVNSNF